MVKVKQVVAREVLDSRGFPTVEVEISVQHSDSQELFLGRAIVPSGASTGEFEALELRDGDNSRFLGKGVLKAVQHVQEKIAPAIVDREFARQSLLDDLLIELDGTSNKGNLGANAILGVSLAFARAASQAEGLSTFESISQLFESTGVTLPVPLMNIINGGAHADNSLAIQEFMIVPAGFDRFKDALQAGVEVFHQLRVLLKNEGAVTAVGDEGGFAPDFGNEDPHERAIEMIQKAITSAGYKPGKQIFIALDAASSEFASHPENPDDPILYRFEGKERTAEEMIDVYENWIRNYPIISIEDGLSEHDWKGWTLMNDRLGKKCQLVGDDLFVTNIEFLKKGIELRAANSILIKLNQIGTLTETLETMRMAAQNGFSAITSHRSGETEDVFIAELAVGTDCGQIKTGSACRTDRIAKYNQLLRIEELLGSRARFAGKSTFRGLES
ncbi:MAG: phosphopyruvate hydratase [Bdellovibrionaceae bacterium]|nr:phosphopyruvate hydratase [Pseudobdellovibrionaceae bacterium]|tara:strand:+ start:1030 stop:2364 length:1335 start_codon:yes stop_codon:yes gene_type:complete